MIYDTLKNIHKYLGIDKNLDTAIEWLKIHSLQQLPLGKTIIDGENVFVNVMQASTRLEHNASYEVHKKYMDLQINLLGGESFSFSNTNCMVDVEKDVGFCKGEAIANGVLKEEWFVLFFPQEAHMPTLSLKKEEYPIKKAVFKIAQSKG